MTRFAYSALDGAGTEVSGEVDAPGEDEAVARLQAQGLYPLWTRPAQNTVKANPLPAKAASRFLRELYVLTQAGVPLDRALTMLAARRSEPQAQSLARRLVEHIRSGLRLGDALALEGSPFGKTATALIAAGEDSGALAPALQNVSTAQARSETLARSVQSAAAYPVIVMSVAGLALLILLTVVLPGFETMYKNLGRSVPPSTALLISVGRFLGTFGPWILMGLLAGTLVAIRRYGQAGLAARFMGQFTRLPIVKPYAKALAWERSTRALALLTRGGVPLARAIALAAESIPEGPLKTSWEEAAQSVRAGRNASDSLEAAGALPPDAIELVSLGEETGRMSDNLETLADLFAEDVTRLTERFTGIIAPLMTLVLGLVVGGIVLVMVSAMFDLYDMPV